VVVANPLQVRLIAEARIRTDKIDAAVLAQLYASGFLPEVWMADERTRALRRQVARRSQIVRQRTRLKNEIHSVLASHLLFLAVRPPIFSARRGLPGCRSNRYRWMSVSGSSRGCTSSIGSQKILR